MPILDWNRLTDTTALEPVEFQIVRQSMAELIKKVAPNANIYPFYELEFDEVTFQRKITPLLKGVSDDAAIYHAWMVSITSASVIGGAEGGTEYVGGYSYTWNVTLEAEGFFDPTGDDPWQVAENELQKLETLIIRNQDMILEKGKFYQGEWPIIDEEAFANGKRLIVAKSTRRVDIAVEITV